MQVSVVGYEPYHMLQQCLILNFHLVIVTENVFFVCLFLESIKC